MTTPPAPNPACPDGSGAHRIWLHGHLRGGGSRPSRRLAADIAERAPAHGVAFTGWEFAKGTVANDDPLGDPIPVTVGGTVLRWDHPDLGPVRIAMMLRDLPRPVIGWGGEEMTCEWALVADAEQRWTHAALCPVLGLGLLGSVGKKLREERHTLRKPLRAFLRDQPDEPLPILQSMPIEELSDDRLQQLLARITASDRAEGLLICTWNTVGQVVDGMLTDGKVILWPGLTSHVMLTPEGREVLARHLPDRHVPADGARWYAPATDTVEDEFIGRGKLTGATALARLVDRALDARMRSAPVGLAADAAVLMAPGARLLVPAAPNPLQVLRDRNAALADDLDRTRRLLAEHTEELARARRSAAAERQRADRLQQDLAAAIETVRQRDTENADLKRQLNDAHTEADRSAAVAEQAEDELAENVRARQRLARTLARIAPHAEPAGGTDEQLPADFGALIALASRRFSLLILDDLDVQAARVLDLYPPSAAWRRRTWDALVTLQSYAEAQRANRAGGDLRTYCRSGAPGAAIPAGIIATGEHDTVRANEQFRAARTFPVRPETHPSGEAPFFAHIRLGSSRIPAPRLHYLDDTARTGHIYVGYIGPHLPNRRTN